MPAIHEIEAKLAVAQRVRERFIRRHPRLERLQFPGKIVVVSNRLPGDSFGGLVTAMKPITEAMGQNAGLMWIGWSGETAPAEKEGLEEAYRTESQNGVERVGLYLTQTQHNLYYKYASNGVLWWLLHGGKLMPKVDFKSAKETNAFAVYEEVNKRFAETVLANTTSKDFVWVQDYHLMTVGGYIRKQRPDQKTGFYLHTPFSKPDEFGQIFDQLGDDVGINLLKGLLSYDLVGFPTKDALSNYTACLDKFSGKFKEKLGIDFTIKRKRDGSAATVTLVEDGIVRTVNIQATPISIDAKAFTDLASRPSSIEKAVSLADTLPSSRRSPGRVFGEINPGAEYIGTLGRLEPTKGLTHLARAFSRFIDKLPQERRAQYQLLLMTPFTSRTDDPIYQHEEHRMGLWTAAMNNRMRKRYGINVDAAYMNEDGVREEELAAYYLALKLFFMPSLEEGTGLVTKEAVAMGTPSVNSVRAGANDSMSDAMTIDPLDIPTFAAKLRELVDMAPEELRRYVEKLAENVYEHTIYHYTRQYLKLASDLYS